MRLGLAPVLSSEGLSRPVCSDTFSAPTRSCRQNASSPCAVEAGNSGRNPKVGLMSFELSCWARP